MQPTLEPTDVSSRPSAVLVTGAWSPPEDWRLVIDSLRTRGVDVVAVDLPSNRQANARRDDDVAETRRAITEAHGPVVVVGWSYGGTVISDAAAGQDNVVRLIYLAALPLAAHPDAGDEPPTPDPDVSHVLFPDEQTCVLDDEWWLTEGDGEALPESVIAYLWTHRRRPMSLTALLAPQQGDAWRSIPTTLVLGRHDDLNPKELQDWARSHFEDVRIVDSDHFIPLRLPGAVADIVTAACEQQRSGRPQQHDDVAPASPIVTA